MGGEESGPVSGLMAVINQLWAQLEGVLRFPMLPTQRIYGLYLLSTLMFALFVFSRSSMAQSLRASEYPRQFAQFLFPARVWKSASAWLDVRYFFFNNFLWISVFGSLGVSTTEWATSHFSEVLLSSTGGAPLFFTENYFLGGIIYMFFLLIVIDFTTFIIHYLQHKVSWLWAFHKVHHSATVMHPLTNYREHPVDSAVYVIGVGLVTGVVAGMSNFLFGGIFSTPKIIGISVLAFAFNFLAYNLRHSHIWLRWPGKWIYLFGCPAHHQVHHSCHPDHIDRNFAFMFPVWDLMFGSFCLPETNKDVKFGLGNGEEADFKSCLGLYFVPFRKLWQKHRQNALLNQ